MEEPPDIPSTDTGQLSNSDEIKCTQTICLVDENKHKLECAECKRLVHYGCTLLPLYQLQQFLVKGYRKYVCSNCIVVPDYLANLKTNTDILVSTPQALDLSSHSRTMSELTIALNQSAEESDHLKVLNQALLNKHDQLHEELAKQVLVNSKQLSAEENEALTNKNIQLEAALVEYTNTVKRMKEDIEKLKSEIEGYEHSMKAYEESELNLKAVIVNQQKDLKEQGGKFHETDKDFDKFVKLEDSMNKKIDDIGKSLRETLLKEVQNSNTKIENKLNEVTKTYAESLLQNAQPSSDQASTPTIATDFRTIMEVTRNEDLAEENEKKLRVCNLIIHGVNESTSNDNTEVKKHDVAFVSNLIETVRVTIAAPKTIIRIGKFDPNKRRPIKVVLNSEDDKNRIMAGLTNLRDQEMYKGISITEDYTLKERQMIKEKAVEARSNNDKELPDSRYIWRVRGTPKNGLTVKRFQKRKPSTSAMMF